MGRIGEGIKNMVKKWLGIKPAQDIMINVQEGFSFEQNAFRNRLWYLGDPAMLSEFFKNVQGDKTNPARFWAVVPDDKNYIRKIHSDIPTRAVDKLTDIVMTDFEGIEFADTEAAVNEDWEAAAKDNVFAETMGTSVSDAAVIGDGAFKLLVNQEVSEYPIIQWVEGDKIDINKNYGRLESVVFYAKYEHDKKTYTLQEIYSAGRINYKLFNEQDKEVAVNSIPQTADFVDVEFNTDIIFAVPMQLKKSKQYKNRGSGLFDGKSDIFDALDESLSQWMDALRAGRTQTYIPQSLLPTDEKGNIIRYHNPISSRWTETDKDTSQNAKNQITTTQAQIQAQDYATTHISILDSALQGIISPSTLGIDVKKLDNAEAQREKEKTTLYSRQLLIDMLQETIPVLVNAVLNLYNLMKGRAAQEYDCKLLFGEYANPSFEALVETISKAAPGKQIFTWDDIVEELWGKDLTPEEKKAKALKLEALNTSAAVGGYLPTFDLGTATNGQGGQNEPPTS